MAVRHGSLLDAETPVRRGDLECRVVEVVPLASMPFGRNGFEETAGGLHERGARTQGNPVQIDRRPHVH